jgi:tetratricopeptide (TPR) repeat protein
VRDKELIRLGDELDAARSGPVEAYVEVLERALSVCEGDREAAEYLDELGLHDELAATYDRLGRVEEALLHADVLAERGYACTPDPRCRRAEILTRHGRLEEAAAIWEAVARDSPEDVWVYNNAGLEYQAVGEHETALAWLTPGLELAVRTGDPERLVAQLRDLRARSLAAQGRAPDDLQTAEPVRVTARTPPRSHASPVTTLATARRPPTEATRAVWAWLPVEEYAHLSVRWPDIADGDLVLDEEGCGRVSHAVYSWRMDRRLRQAQAAGVTELHVAPLDATDYARWLAQQGADESDPAQLRAGYAAHLGRDPSRVIAWPPGRNERCWCGSGRKYKKCCGAPAPGGLQ